MSVGWSGWIVVTPILEEVSPAGLLGTQHGVSAPTAAFWLHYSDNGVPLVHRCWRWWIVTICGSGITGLLGSGPGPWLAAGAHLIPPKEGKRKS